jgi:hypothetical protein
MNRPRAMGLGAMFVLLVVSVILLPMIVRFISRKEYQIVSGFADLVQNVPPMPSQYSPKDGGRDPNTSYLCRSPNGDGTPCREGTFCDGTTNSCIKNYVCGEVPSVGYFA